MQQGNAGHLGQSLCCYCTSIFLRVLVTISLLAWSALSLHLVLSLVV